jgi:hypothetical protein
MQCTYVIDAGWHEQRNALFRQIGAAIEKSGSDTINTLVEVGVAVTLIALNQGYLAIAVVNGGKRERRHSLSVLVYR